MREQSSAPMAATIDRSLDVFLSFDGEDTRSAAFAGHLSANLRRKGITAFMEEEETECREQIDPAVIGAIKRSRIAIVLLSHNYMASSRCLDELARIVECGESEGKTIVPVFYRVDPIKLRKRSGELGRAIEVLDERFKDDADKSLKWRDALLKTTSIFGWKFVRGYESEFIERIAEDVSRRVGRTVLYAAEPLTRMESLLNELKSFLCNGSPEICLVGLCGTSGIAKKTLAKACYNALFESFEGSSFLENVGATSKQSNGLAHLQEILLTDTVGDNGTVEVANVARGVNLIRERLHSKRVLIVLDGVDRLDQLEALAGSRDWFGPGSRILITTGDEHLLVVQGVERRYKINEPCSDDHTIQHLGFPCDEIHDAYKAEFDALEDHEKAILLDTACFFRGEDKDNVVKMLRNCNLYPDIGIPVLIDKSLVHTKGNELQLNDVLQHMGRDIARRGSPRPGNCSRLWFHEDVLQVFEENTGTNAVEGILIDLPEANDRVLNAKAFANMRRLRLLIVKNACFSGSPEYLPNELRWLEWSNYPSPSLPSGFRPKKLTVLKLRSGIITRLWDGFKMCSTLAVVELTKCELLREIPDVSAVPNLEKLIVVHCTGLVSVHESVGFLERLTILNFDGCYNLRLAPPELRLVSLETLILRSCSMLEEFPEISVQMERVESIDLSNTGLKELPASIGNLTGLRYLNLNSCRNLEALPSNIHSLPKLIKLNLKGCDKLRDSSVNTNLLVNIETRES